MNPYKVTGGVAILLSLGTTAAHAQSSVVLYGLLDTSIQYARSGGVSTTRLDSSEVQTSLWGIKGTEELGGTYKAIFKLENGFNVNNGANAQTNKQFGREAWVGLSGPFGTLTAGVHNDEMMWGLIRYSMGDLGHWDWGHASNNYDFFASTRVSNSIVYETNNLNGFRFSAMYARGTNGDLGAPRTLGDTVSASVSYNRGPLSMEAIYESQVYAESATINAATSTHTGNFEFYGVSYDFNIVKLGGLVMVHRGAGNLTATNFAGYADPNNIYYDVSAVLPHFLGSNGSLLFSFGQYFLQRSSSGDSASWGARYDYHISPRTGIYAGVAGILNGRAANFTQTGAQYTGIPVGVGKNQVALLVGMMTHF